jgi:hypothetical protein
MSDQTPIFTRVMNVPKVFGVSTSTIYRWKKAKLITIHKVRGCSVIRTADMIALFSSSTASAGGPSGGPEE